MPTARPRSRTRPDLIHAYLDRRPERDPKILIPRSAVPLLRAAVLLHGVVVRGWSLGWLAAFLFAEFFLVLRLAVVGDRFAKGHQLDPQLHRRTSLGTQVAWLVVSIASVVLAGLALAASQAGQPLTSARDLGRAASAGGAAWGIAGYLALLVVDFVVDLRAARREGRPYATSAAVQATFFLMIVVLSSFLFIALAGLGARGVFALQLVASRALAELAVLWLPLLAPRLEALKGRRAAG